MSRNMDIVVDNAELRNVASASSRSAVPALAAVKLSLGLGGVVLVLLMVFGLCMRLAQGGLLSMDPALFYEVMTAHGAGMVGTAALTGAAIMWFFLARHVELAGSVYWLMLGFFLVGVVLVLGAVFVGGFAGAWTFLYPLPARSGGVWEPGAAALFLTGLISIGLGFLIFYLEIGRAIIARYGNLSRAMGWPLLVAGTQDDVPPPAVVASAAVIVFNGIGIVVGAAVLVISLINLYASGFAIDPLVAKNMIYFFGHVFINATIYMAVIAVYEIMPEYTGRPWKTSRIFAAAWSAILLMVLAVYPHHLLQDTVMPGWALAIGQVVSYMAGLPVVAVTAFSLLAYLNRSGIRWDLASALLVASVFGWTAGIVPAIIDAIIVVNKVMHNTLWVPGHFHFYLLIGEMAMVFGFMAWLTRRSAAEKLAGAGYWGFLAYLTGGLGVAVMFLIGGAMSVPRRWAEHLPEWFMQDRIGSLFAVLSIVGTLVLLGRFLVRLGSTAKT
jgi:cytochrome c oxidase subunit I